MAALVLYESRGNPYAIDDDTARRSFFPKSAAAALALENNLLERGHSIDVGLAQVNVSNFDQYGLTRTSALEPCDNLSAGSAILRDGYLRAQRHYAIPRLALLHALSAYNSGSETGDADYARNVLLTARTLRWPSTSYASEHAP